MRATLWCLLPSDGEFRRAPNGVQYYLARQGRRVVLRGGDVTHPLYESRMRWIPDPTPSPPRRAGQEFPVPLSDSFAPIPSDSVRSRDVNVMCVELVIHRHLPLLRESHQELLSPHLSLRNAGEGEEDRLAEQPIKIEHPVQLPQ